ncbi:hypothetical protein IQB76_21525, partial [Leptospira borgpetersenii serovar Hardjo-bovis]|uniref:hypothetical protein n=1 Tax=Leptospira borgpetersenii TaxID=174 RepID=UPI00187E5982
EVWGVVRKEGWGTKEKRYMGSSGGVKKGLVYVEGGNGKKQKKKLNLHKGCFKLKKYLKKIKVRGRAWKKEKGKEGEKKKEGKGRKYKVEGMGRREGEYK